MSGLHETDRSSSFDEPVAILSLFLAISVSKTVLDGKSAFRIVAPRSHSKLSSRQTNCLFSSTPLDGVGGGGGGRCRPFISCYRHEPSSLTGSSSRPGGGNRSLSVTSNTTHVVTSHITGACWNIREDPRGPKAGHCMLSFNWKVTILSSLHSVDRPKRTHKERRRLNWL